MGRLADCWVGERNAHTGHSFGSGNRQCHLRPNAWPVLGNGSECDTAGPIGGYQSCDGQRGAARRLTRVSGSTWFTVAPGRQECTSSVRVKLDACTCGPQHGKHCRDAAVGNTSDVLAIDPGNPLLYVAAESGALSVFDLSKPLLVNVDAENVDSWHIPSLSIQQLTGRSFHWKRARTGRRSFAS